MDFKVRCTKAFPGYTTLGRTYFVKDSRLTFDNGDRSTECSDVLDLNKKCGSRFELVPDLPRICYILGGEDNPLKVDERFCFTTNRGSTIDDVWVGNDGNIHRMANQDALTWLINHPEKIIRQPQFSEDEKALMRLYVGAGHGIFERHGDHVTASNFQRSVNAYIPSGLFPQITDKNSPFDAKAYLEGLK